MAMVFGLAFLGTVAAEDAAKKQPPIALSKAEVAKCVKALPEFVKICPSFSPEAATAGGGGSMAKMLQGAATQAKLKAFTTKYGYANFLDFAKSMSGVMSAYAAMKMETALVEIKKQMAANPQIAGMMQAQMKPLLEGIKRMKSTITPATYNAVKPHFKTLDKIFSGE